MNILKTFLLSAALSAPACVPAEGPNSDNFNNNTLNYNTREVKDVCATTSKGSLRCIGFDSDGNENVVFVVDCPKKEVPANAGGYYDDTNNTKDPAGKPLDDQLIRNKLEKAVGGVSCVPSTL